MEYIVEDVPYIQQPDQITCWNACYKMMLKYKQKAETDADNLPNDAEMRTRGILDSEFATCRNKLGLSSTTYKALMTPEGLKEKLETYGPIWCSGFWADTHKHIVVVRGVRTNWTSDPEVYVNDPYRGLSGAKGRPSWWTWSRFEKLINPVSYACQHWF